VLPRYCKKVTLDNVTPALNMSRKRLRCLNELNNVNKTVKSIKI